MIYYKYEYYNERMEIKMNYYIEQFRKLSQDEKERVSKVLLEKFRCSDKRRCSGDCKECSVGEFKYTADNLKHAVEDLSSVCLTDAQLIGAMCDNGWCYKSDNEILFAVDGRSSGIKFAKSLGLI